MRSRYVTILTRNFATIPVTEDKIDPPIMDCCIPNIERIGGEVPAPSGIGEAAKQGVPANDFVRLEGEFLMGTRAPVRNRRDGEDPVRRITVSPFSIATTTVTNGEFAVFVEATGHVTEAEQFGWSFVLTSSSIKNSAQDNAVRCCSGAFT